MTTSITAITADNHPVITYQNVRVTTTELLAQFYGTDTKNLRMNFTNNKDRFVESKHYFKLEGENLRQFKELHKANAIGLVEIAPQIKHLMLWTQRGAARHAKILDTDKAWDVFEQLEEAYFKPQSTTPALPPDSKQYNEVDALKIASIASRAAKAFGFTGNQAVISVSNAVKNITGIDPLQLMGQSHLIADQRGRTYTPTELGKMMEPPRSGRVLNKMLEAFGLIEKDVLGNWLPTTKADGLYEWLDTGKRHSDGAPVKQLKWFSETLKLIGNSEQLTSVVH